MFQKTDDNFSNKDFPRGQVNGFADNLDFEKIKTWDRLKNNTADPSRPTHLALAIAAQTHCDTKAMSRAKPQTHSKLKSNYIFIKLRIKIANYKA